MDKDKGIVDVVSWLLNDGPDLGRYEDWILDPKNKDALDALNLPLKERCHIVIDVDELEKE